MNIKEIEKLRKAGIIAREVREYSKKIIKKDELLREIADKIEDKIVELGGKPAFPTTLCINEVAAHYTPSYDDETKAEGLLKVDFGISVDGFVADTAFSVDLDNISENKKLIKASEECLANAIKAIESGKNLGEVGAKIQETAEEFGGNSIKNLSGHQIEKYRLHAGITIPNYDNKSNTVLNKGVYAIEPFITFGTGLVYDGKPSGIYELKRNGAIRDRNAREVFEYILEEYQTLPFCSRWLVKKFGTRVLLSLRIIEQSGALHHFAQLIEKSKSIVAQSEHTLLVSDGKVEVIT
ncbi:MAG TPA: type II methionyl aminopeptidase [Candidatus Paceibacterota bacterium]|nr:type II methionyl aminopeptidase [Candidatus Paceibacterota bacterium]